uniref:Acetylornithine deacetylase n=1 Tax=Herpetomonas muscarum TaxID=5718 RepID=U5KLK9_HERMU|nr:acetylornithine deacetylase [Herpetomonas muscarum]
MSLSGDPSGAPDPCGAKEWLGKLISFDTTSSKTNVPFIQYVAAYARAALRAPAGAPADCGARVLVEWGPQQAGVSYANLVISIPAFPPLSATASGDSNSTGKHPVKNGEEDGAPASAAAPPTSAAAAGCRGPVFDGGYALSGHSDVVPVDGQQWDTDPFTMVEKDGRLYGRGACDMKAFLAVMLCLVPEWAEAMAARRLRRPLHLVFSYSEETDMAGCRQLVGEGSESWRRLRRCEGVVIGEPTNMELVVAHKGIHENHITCRGTAAHSSLQPHSFNAIAPAARVLTALFALRDRFVATGPYDSQFAVPYTTLCPGALTGGQALNTTPDRCCFAYQIRNIPTHSAAAIEREIAAVVARENAAVQDEVERMNRSSSNGTDNSNSGAGNSSASPSPTAGGGGGAPAVAASVEHGECLSAPHFLGDAAAAVVTALQRAAQADDGGDGPTGASLQKVSFYTEAGYFQQSGLNTVVCGPGDIAQAHRANEFVTVSQLEKAVRVIRATVEELCF